MLYQYFVAETLISFGMLYESNRVAVGLATTKLCTNVVSRRCGLPAYSCF